MPRKLLVGAAEGQLPRLDEKLYVDVFQPATPMKTRGGAKKKPEARE